MSSTYELVPHATYGFGQVHPTPSPEEITAFYAQEFYDGDAKLLNDSGLAERIRNKQFDDGRWADVCTQLEAITKAPLDDHSVLDIGCGYGMSLLYFRERGMTVAGFDPAPEAVQYAQDLGLDVRCAGIERMDVFDGRRFDVVTLFNVLEHLADPVAVVQEIRDVVLTPGGVLVVDVPNDFNAFQLAGRKAHDLAEWWVAPPGHLNYFSPATLRGLLEGEGFDVPLVKGSFPVEMFLLFGQNYVGHPEVGRACHEQRVAFEANLRAAGMEEVLHDFYVGLAANGLGRVVSAYAQVL